ncbi:MAG: PLP-dependent aminotransferase family protein [Clostridiales bacterium]|nr:PLP-dependent aminotransferase family protein [Clostridiales bacterium]
MEYTFSRALSDMKPSAIREIFKSLTDPEIIAFAAGNPAPESFPASDFAELAAEIFAEEPTKALQYGITEGYPALRAQCADRLRDRFNSGRDFDDTIIVSGGQQGLELCCKALCSEGDAVICENPSFIGALNAFRSIGCRTIGVPLTDRGIDLEKLEATFKNEPKAKILYVIPTFQNPAGSTTDLETRRGMYALAKKYGIIILEDNPYGELRFAGEELPTLKSLDEDGIVVYCGSFSKVLSAGMRIGFVCAPKPIISKMVVAKQVEDVHTNQLSQMLCSRFIAKRDLDAHIASVRAIYRGKCRLMLGELDKVLAGKVKFTRPEGGLFIWCTLPEGVMLDDFVKAAMKRKVAVVPGTAFNCDPSAPSDSFRITYSTPSEEQIVRGIALLGEALDSLR